MKRVILAVAMLCLVACASLRVVPAQPLPGNLDDIDGQIRLMQSAEEQVDEYNVPGDDFAWAVPRLVQYAVTHTNTLMVAYAQLTAATGYAGATNCNAADVCIVRLESTLTGNATLATLFHELAHVNAEPWHQDLLSAEIMAESTAYLAAVRIGLNTRVESLSYLAAYSTAEQRRAEWKLHGESIKAWANDFAEAVGAKPHGGSDR